MRTKIKNTALPFFLFIATLTVQLSFGQNLLLLHDKVGNSDCVVRTGKRVKIQTVNKQVIKGKISEIRDSSIVINNKATTEITINDIRYLYFRNSNGWKTAGGIFFAFVSFQMTVFVIAGLSEGIKANNSSNNTNDNPIPGLAVIGANRTSSIIRRNILRIFSQEKI